jgi:hypothetical protein
VLALAIEGGGMGGAVSAGMCVMLDALGLVQSFDVVYGSSSGALNGLWTAAGQASLGATNYEDAASREFISTLRLLRGRPIVDMRFLFEEIASRVKPFSPDGLAAGPELRVLACSLERREAAVLRDFVSPAETLAAVRASCALPALAELLSHRAERYNAAAEELAGRAGEPGLGGRVVQLAVPERDVVGRLERDRERVLGGQRAGAREVAAALCRDPAELLWRPQAYRVKRLRATGTPPRDKLTFT